MCGIAGILTNANSDGLVKRVEWMQASIQHRGPDDQGLYIAPSRQAMLAHARLSILDLSSAGHQPMDDGKNRFWITFNGEIYNFRALRLELEQKGYHFQSQTDTEVILKLYQHYGADCVKYLRGMFAFAIWDEKEKSCFLARDPLGIKPLYYWRSGSQFVFASELRAVLASRLPSVRLSPEGLHGYLLSGSVPEPYTLIADVICLPAGHCLYWKAGEVTQQSYWQVQFESQSRSISQFEAQQIVREALLESIEHHFISDVPVGVFLSGGIDSSAVVALARQIQRGTLKTYSIAFEEPEWNEGDVAAQVANRFETQHTEQVITAAMGRALLPQFLAAIDQPTIDGFNSFCVSQVANQYRTKVVLSGLGGDELFSGYGSFTKVPQLLNLGSQLKRVYPLNKAIGMGLEHWTSSPQLRRVGDFLQQTPTVNAAYQTFRGIFSHREAAIIARSYLPDIPFPSREQPVPLSISSDIRDEVSWLEISGYMRNQLLRDSDIMSMAWGLELRVPFVDHVLVETIATIPADLRLMPGKKLLVQAVPELPNWVYERPKKGFSFPFQKWMENDFKNNLQTNIYQGISLHLWYRRWSIFILHHWWQRISNER